MQIVPLKGYKLSTIGALEEQGNLTRGIEERATVRHRKNPCQILGRAGHCGRITVGGGVE